MNPNSLIYRKGFTFTKHSPEEVSHFDRVFDVFKDLLTHTSGDLEEAFEWLEMLDKEYDIFTDEYSLADFEEDLKKRGYTEEELNAAGLLNRFKSLGNQYKSLLFSPMALFCANAAIIVIILRRPPYRMCFA